MGLRWLVLVAVITQRLRQLRAKLIRLEVLGRSLAQVSFDEAADLSLTV